MRFLSFRNKGRETVGVRFGQEVVDLGIADPTLPGTLLGLIRAGLLAAAHDAAARAGKEARVSADGLTYLPVIARPDRLLGIGANYGGHVGTRWASPGFLTSSASRVAAHGEPLLIPTASPTLDYEAELAVILRKGGKDIPRGHALDCIAGYTVINEGSLRGYGMGDTIALMKNGDKTAAIGPEMVTPDELPLGGDGLRLTARRNGVEVQNDTTSSMYWKVPEIIELLSQFMTLEAGDIIATGTPGGTIIEFALARNIPWDDPSIDYLKDGEVIECEVEGIGLLRNAVVAER